MIAQRLLLSLFAIPLAFGSSLAMGAEGIPLGGIISARLVIVRSSRPLGGIGWERAIVRKRAGARPSSVSYCAGRLV